MRLLYGVSVKQIEQAKNSSIFDIDGTLKEIRLPCGISIPEEIREFKGLEKLYLRDTLIQKHQFEIIDECKSLKALSIRNSKIPDKINQSLNVKYLDLSFCEVKNFPVIDSISLSSLTLAGNQISSILPITSF